MVVLFGTSGWGYQEWVGAFYPSNRVAKLPFYSRVFDTVEVDSSFYRLPSKSMSTGWTRATGSMFKFSLKLPKSITHDKKLSSSAHETEVFLERIGPIIKAGKLGSLLIQLPPSFTYNDKETLESYLEVLPEDIRFAVEFRHESWDREESWNLLSKYNIANTVTDSPIGFLSKPVVTTSTHCYVRWHGRGKPLWYDYGYSGEELAVWKERLVQIEEQVQIVYAYFNNHYGANAPSNLLTLLQLRGELSESQKRALKRYQRFQKKHVESHTSMTKLTDFV